MAQDKCIRCGRCCLLKICDPVTGLGSVLTLHCPHYTLDNGKGKCKIYGHHTGTIIMDQRTGWKGSCLSVEQMIAARLCPEDCPYAKDIPGYRSNVINYEEMP